MKYMKTNYSQLTMLPLFWGILFILVTGTVFHVGAQEGEEWTEPTNLSQSGAATEPVLIEDSGGAFHVFWQDAFAGFMYVNGDGSSWNQPLSLQLPFSEPPFTTPASIGFARLYNPVLQVDNNNLVHGFWINAVGTLLTSRAAVPELTSPTAWTAPQELAGSTMAKSIVIDASGRLHLSYAQSAGTAESPVGIYYRRSDDSGATWTVPILLYQSDYLRSTTAEQAHVKIVAASAERIHIVWDNPLLESVFTARSLDGGVTWDAPTAIDKREAGDALAAVGPANIDIAVRGSEVHLSWRAMHETTSCIQYHQWSNDGGETWQPRQPVFEDSVECSSDGWLLAGESLLFLVTKIRQELYFQAWDGVRWSGPEIQLPLSGFADPQTYRQVNYECLRFVVNNNHLLVVGCGSTIVQDIWLMQRPLGDMTTWFSSESIVWSPPAPVASSAFAMFPSVIVADANSSFHTFWIGTNDGLRGEPQTAIYYARWDGSSWSLPAPIIRAETDQLTAALDQEERFFVVWRDLETGMLLFSRADMERAAFPTDWGEPQTLVPAPSSAFSSPDVLVDQSGNIHVAYAISFNEGRGIYHVRSEDRGGTWAEPVTVFDAVAADWAVVDQPRLTQTDNGHLHLLWTHYSLASANSLGLYYARSENGGLDWSMPELVDEGEVPWSQIVGVGEGNVFRLWQKVSEGSTDFWYQQSIDGGLSWSRAALVSGSASLAGATQLTRDTAGQLHLLQLVGNSSETLALREWLWRDGRWETQEDVGLARGMVTESPNLVAALGPDGRLLIVYPGMIVDQESQVSLKALFSTYRTFDLAGVTTSAQPAADSTATPVLPTAVPPTAEPVLPTPLATEVPDVQAEDLQLPSDPSDRGSPIDGILAGILPAGLIVVLVFIAGLRITRIGRR